MSDELFRAALASHIAGPPADLATARAQTSAALDHALLLGPGGRNRSVIGIGSARQGAVSHATAVHLVLDRDTGLVGLIEIAAIHGGSAAGKADDVESAIVGTIGAIFGWAAASPAATQLALGYIGADAAVPSILDVPPIALTLSDAGQGASATDAAHVAALATTVAVLDALRNAGLSVIQLPLEADAILHQAAENIGTI